MGVGGTHGESSSSKSSWAKDWLFFDMIRHDVCGVPSSLVIRTSPVRERACSGVITNAVRHGAKIAKASTVERMIADDKAGGWAPIGSVGATGPKREKGPFDDTLIPFRLLLRNHK